MPDDSTREEVVLRGIAASPGVAHGTALVYLQERPEVPCYEVREDQVEQEIERFDQAILKTRREISDVRNKVAASLGEGEARIFDAHLMVLEDSALIDEVIAKARASKKNIEHCYNTVAERYIEFFSSMEDEYLKERVADIRDVSRRLLQNLSGMRQAYPRNIAADSIIVSEDFTPSEAAELDRSKLLGFVTDGGGKTSHSVIMARSLGIPAVVGMHDATRRIKTGDEIIVDGHDGVVVLNPGEVRLFQYGKRATRRRKLDELYRSVLHEKSETRNGESIGLMANIEGSREMEQAGKMRTDGVGLFRTEGLFLRHQGSPPEEEQYEEYAAVAEAVDGRPVIIRTLDIGGDKTLGNESLQEDNSFMGFRAIRFCLENLDIFETQLRAILRASSRGNVKLMYPMISGLEELKRAGEVLEKVKRDLRDAGEPFDEAIEVGAMVEVPSAATIVDLLARQTDFLSIGTNDLIQYLMAVDRLNDRVAHLYDPAHPAVLRTIRAIIEGGRHAGIPVSICGEIAGDPVYAGLLFGMGASSLSLSISLFPEVKYLIRKMDGAAARSLAEEVLCMEDPAAILERLESFRNETLGDLSQLDEEE